MSTTGMPRAAHDEPAAGTNRAKRNDPLIVRLDRTPRRRSAGGSARRRLRSRLAISVAVAALTAATGYAVGAATGEAAEPLGPGLVRVEVGIERSAFDLPPLRVREGTIVEFVVRNGDPIDHELVVGEPEVHQRHAGGTERRHPPIPGEVSVPPGDTGLTFYRFDEPGSVVYACHLPGHVAYGMVGEIEVVAG